MNEWYFLPKQTSLLLFQFCHKLKMVEEVKDTIFVGGIPYDMTLEEFEEEVQIWGKKRIIN